MSTFVNHLRTFTDDRTGREVRQLTDFPRGAYTGYFRMDKHLPDGRILTLARHDHGNTILIDPDSGDIELVHHAHGVLRLRESDGRLWYLTNRFGDSGPNPKAVLIPGAAQLGHVDLPNGDHVIDADLPDDLPGIVADITIDGRYLILNDRDDHAPGYAVPDGPDPVAMAHFYSRPRSGAMYAYDVTTGNCQGIVRTQDIAMFHQDASPADPGLVRYAVDMPETEGQRVWSVRVDGSDRRPIRPQLPGEVVTHEFWWSDPNYIGYTYQDRREDPTLDQCFWAEYAQAHTRLGIADLTGKEVYLSDPLNSYHTHLYRSPDGRFVSGEGTDGNFFVYAAAFDINSTRLDMIPLAAIHTPYIPFRGQFVDCCFSADSRWLIYSDQLHAKPPQQIFAVATDL